MKYLDKPSERCSYEARDVNATACIADYIQSRMGCNTNIRGDRGYNSTTRPACTTTSQLREFADLSGKNIQGDHSGRVKPPVDIKKVLF